MANSRTYRTSDVPTLGMRGSHNWTAEEAPDSYRESILYLYPNGSAPLTALTSKLANKPEEQAHFHWFTKTLPQKGADIEYVYETETSHVLSDALNDATVADGKTLYVPLSATFQSNVRPGHECLLRDSDNHAADVVGKVTDVYRNGDSSYAVVSTIVHGNAVTRGTYDRFMIIGNINPEGSTRPGSISYNAAEFGNFQQTFRTPMLITRNANIKNRLGDPYQTLKRETLEDHSIELEWALTFGELGWTTNPDNGMPERTTMGLVPFIKHNAPSNIINCKTQDDLGWEGKDWGGSSGYGLDAIEYIIRRAFEYGKDTEKPALVGAGALAAIQQAVRGNSDYSISRGEAAYGIKVVTVESVFGTIHLIKHPLWTMETSQQNSLLTLTPQHLEFRYALDTKFCKDDRFGKGGGDGLDGIVEEFMTECGLAVYHPETFVYAYNLGAKNTAS